jgi:hypothetical protein
MYCESSVFRIRREIEVAVRNPIAEVTEFDVQLFQGGIRSDKVFETVILLIRGFNTNIEERRMHDLLRRQRCRFSPSGM